MALLAATAGLARYLGARDRGWAWIKGADWISWAVAFDVAALMLVIGTAAAVANSTRTSATGITGTLLGQIRRFLQRQRVNFLVVAGFAVVATLVPQTSGQAIDSVRTWGLGDADSLARLAFGLASTLVLSLVVYESALWLAQAEPYKNDEADLDDPQPQWWLLAAAGFGVAGVAVLLIWPAQWGLFVFAAVALLLAVLELIPLKPASRPEPKANPQDEYSPEYLAIVPLLSVAAITVAAAVDASMTEGFGREQVAVILPGLLLAFAAVVMTAEGNPPTLRRPGGWLWVLTSSVALGLALIVAFVIESTKVAAVLGLAGVAAALAYAGWIFRPTAANIRLAATLPVAVGTGLAVLFAVNADVDAVANPLGVLALVNIALALLVAVLHVLVRGSLAIRPPRPLWWFGLAQVPIVTLLLICWALAGLVNGSTTHAARLVESPPLKAEAQPWEQMPTLREAFQGWVAAQPELKAGAPGGEPIPLVAVASHGGGIRAAHWAALALDCVVGASAQTRSLQAARSAGGLFSRTCAGPRRSTKNQRTAARRIFLASGVSGGAVGLYAYARELLNKRGALGEQAWVENRLGRDFASATVAWALFHDTPNHVLGLHSDSPAACASHLGKECLTEDRAAVLERSFDSAWKGRPPRLRETWALRVSPNPALKEAAESVPLIVANSTVTGGSTRAILSAADLAAWPRLEQHIPVPPDHVDPHPLAGTVEVSDALCPSKDMRLSTAAILASRFPFVAPSGHLEGDCRGTTARSDAASPCAQVLDPTVCDVDLVDGGYTDNSGLFTLAAVWPSLTRLVVEFNRQGSHRRKIALAIVEIDNHYRTVLTRPPQAGKNPGQTLVPLSTAFGGRRAIEAFARAVAYRLTRPGCAVTILPGTHPGLTAPLGWELSKSARDDLRRGLVRPYRSPFGIEVQPVETVQLVQQWLGPKSDPSLRECLPVE